MNSIHTSHCGCEWRGQEGGSKPPEALPYEKQERRETRGQVGEQEQPGGGGSDPEGVNRLVKGTEMPFVKAGR